MPRARRREALSRARWSRRVEPSTSAKRSVTVPRGRSGRDVGSMLTGASLGAAGVVTAERTKGWAYTVGPCSTPSPTSSRRPSGASAAAAASTRRPISKAMREIRLALLEADVNFEVAKDFTTAVKERALGQDVLKSLTPGQQVVKIVHEELTALMGSGDSRLAFGRPPTVILLAGLQGSGKTTAAAKLALLLRKDGKRPGLVACDLQRPAAIDQLEQLGTPDPDPRLRARPQGSGLGRPLGRRRLAEGGARRRDPGHGGAAPRRRGADGRARTRSRRRRSRRTSSSCSTR